MRKWFWCCAAAGVVAAGSYGAVKYSGKHPESALGVAVTSACKIGLGTMPFTGWHGAPAGAEAGLPGAAPVHCQDGGVAEKPVVQVELPGNTLPPPATIVIRDDEELKEPPLAEPVTTDISNLFGGICCGIPTGEGPPEVRSVHKTMPYADEVEHHAAMPYADEDAAPNSTVGNLFGTGVNGFVEIVHEEQTTPELSLWRRFVRAIQGMGETAGATEESEPKEQALPQKEGPSQSYYPHDHYEVCPYSGHPYVGQPYSPRLVPVEAQKVEPTPGGQEESEPIKPAKVGKNPIRFFDDNRELLQSRPAFPRIDTMEFRPSDHKLNEYEQQPGTL